MNKLLLSAVILALAAGTVSAAKPKGPSKAAQRGLAFAQDHCAACHGVTLNASSPNPESPPFADVANRPGVTQSSLHRFLRDSHNFPEAMQFTVDRARIHDLSAYIITLRRPGYKPTI